MAKRDILAEIADKKVRSEGRYLRGYSELLDLYYEFSRDSGATPARTALYVPGVVACLEVQTREAVKELVDAGQPFLDRAESFKDLRFDFGLTKALSRQVVTFGDLVAHLLPVSQIDNIVSHFDTLLARSFKKALEELKSHVDPDEDMILDGGPWEPMNTGDLMVPDVDHMFSQIADLFRTRHVIAHEAIFLGSAREIVTSWFEEAMRFSEALLELVNQELRPNTPRGSFAASLDNMARANELATKIDEKSNSITALLSSANDEYRIAERFKECMSAFTLLHDCETSLYLAIGSPFGGNAMRNLEAHATTTVCTPRLQQLDDIEKWIRERLRD